MKFVLFNDTGIEVFINGEEFVLVFVSVMDPPPPLLNCNFVATTD